MPRVRTIAILVAALGTSISTLSAVATKDVMAAPPSRAYIIVLEDGQNAVAVANENAAQYGGRVTHVYRTVMDGYAATLRPTAVAELRADPRVVSVVPDRVVRAVEGQASTTTGPTPVAPNIDRIDVERSVTARLDGVDDRLSIDVAILDTGIARHMDLNIAGGKSCVTDERGTTDYGGHGTHVAGIVGARDNGTGVIGVAPGARLWAVKVLNRNGTGTWSSVICGIDWVTARASTIEVVNMSLGGPGLDGSCSDSPLHLAICRSVDAGVTYVAAAGNYVGTVDNFVPATFAEVITVSGLADFDGKPGSKGMSSCSEEDIDDTFADFSSYGADVDLIAPAVCVESTAPGDQYVVSSGTSMASPHVAGAAALFKLRHPRATPALVRFALRVTGRRNWAWTTDPDGIPDRLLNVAWF